jgi:leucyl-tRNA synthetase
LRAKIKIAKDTSKEEMQEIALSNDNVKASIEGKDTTISTSSSTSSASS